MIKLPDIRQKFTDIKEQVEHKVFHPYLLKYIEKPVIDEDKLLILVSIMDRLELSYNEMKNYALTTMLIQIALDTHEHISNASVDEKNRQLTVLAGDYYSGLYYKLLAESEDISMIKELSKGIKEINEHKISIYQRELNGIENLMTSIKKIESSLLVKFSECFKVDLWNEFIANLFFFKRLLHEKRLFMESDSSLVFKTLQEFTIAKTHRSIKNLSDKQQSDLLVICDRYLDSSKQFLLKGMNQLPYLNDMLEARITSIINEHQPIVKTLVEEG
ncbi:heptaprenyl diphosphate synthase [Neobacillus niacini]|uniref:heptaprenyl diphosphate synthase component 1 n=1 Tax=Neobacillus driksii TaxID=3035913 RepID=UPI00278A71BC|nr:heptaprenyl diphosphate synthase component 1 [Neobacillus niacini]MDQ0976153.1 heptaprenyl diphosphate synthase [Neobacillus niacini]